MAFFTFGPRSFPSAKDAPQQSPAPGFVFPTCRHIGNVFNMDHKQEDASEKTRDPGFKILPLNTAPQPLIGTSQLKTHILLKIDDKPSGLDSKLATEHSPSNRLISKAPTLVIGMDVSHDDSPRHPGGSAIATVVHSRTWPLISEYRAYAQTQVSSLPIIEFSYRSLPQEEKKDAGIMREILQDFYTNSGERMPQQIIIFRYSLGEPGFEEILKSETDDLIEACKHFNEKWCPKFVVIKFHEPVGPLNGNPYQLAHAGHFETNVPLDYSVSLNEVCESPGDIVDLVDSFSYLYQMRTAAMSQLAPDLYGSTPETRLREWKMRQKRDIDPEKVCLRRECIDHGVELAVYALAFLNLERDVKHAYGKLLGWSSEIYKGLVEQGVTMEAWEMKGDEASSNVTVLANLRYLGGEYVYIEHCVIRPEGTCKYSYGGKKFVFVPISQSLMDRMRHPHPDNYGAVMDQLAIWARPPASFGAVGREPADIVSQRLLDRERHLDKYGAVLDQSAVWPKPTTAYVRKRKRDVEGTEGDVEAV